jgi:hypothetical protein
VGAPQHLGDLEVEILAQPAELVAEQQVLVVAGDDDEPVRSGITAVGRSPHHAHHRGDADAAGDHDDALDGRDVAGERAVRAVDPDRLAGLEAG